MTELSTRMAKLDFDAKYIDTENSAKELYVLGEHMNELSQTLEQTITRLKVANNELQRDIKKKEEIDEMRKEFLSNVSHELKTPLALISGYAEGLKEVVNDDDESRNFYCDFSSINKPFQSTLPRRERPVKFYTKCIFYKFQSTLP